MRSSFRPNQACHCDDPAYPRRGSMVQGCPRGVGLPYWFLYISSAPFICQESSGQQCDSACSRRTTILSSLLVTDPGWCITLLVTPTTRCQHPAQSPPTATTANRFRGRLYDACAAACAASILCLPRSPSPQPDCAGKCCLASVHLTPGYLELICRYTESSDSDWVIGYYPSDPGLLLATSGSGHAYKVICDDPRRSLSTLTHVITVFAGDRAHRF